MFDVFLAVVVVQIFVGMDVFTISMQCFSYFIFFFRGIFQNHVVDSDYSCFTASSYGYHYCMPRHQEAQASSWVRKFPCRFSCLLIAFSPRSGPLFLRVTVQYLVSFAAVFLDIMQRSPHSLSGGALRDIPKNDCERDYPVMEPFSFSFSTGCVLSLMSCFAEKLLR